MWFSSLFMCLASAATWQTIATASLADVCTTSYLQSVLPANGFVDGVDLSTASVRVNSVRDFTVAASASFPGKSHLDFCNVTFSYGHTGLATKASNALRILP